MPCALALLLLCARAAAAHAYVASPLATAPGVVRQQGGHSSRYQSKRRARFGRTSVGTRHARGSSCLQVKEATVDEADALPLPVEVQVHAY